MSKFKALYEKYMTEEKGDAPNYRKAEQNDGEVEPKCTSCIHNKDGMCEKFNFVFDPDFTCDDYAPQIINKDQA